MDPGMVRVRRLLKLYGLHNKEYVFDYDSIWHSGINTILSNYDLMELYRIITSARLNALIQKKMKLIDSVMRSRGFIRFGSGTNRVCYKSDYDQGILLKVALDTVGMSDNISEYYNQNIIKPFCCKIFEVSKSGVVSLIERVNPIMNRKQFSYIASDVFDILFSKIIGKYVMEDIGCDFFMNWGVREGFGPVILDFPYCYVVDGEKLKCTRKDHNGIQCPGYIDYDAGLNTLICETCGHRYTARSLGKDLNLLTAQEAIEKGESSMFSIKVSSIIDGKRYDFNPRTEDDFILRARKERTKEQKRTYPIVRAVFADDPVNDIRIVPSKEAKDDTVAVETENKIEETPQQQKVYSVDEKVDLLKDPRNIIRRRNDGTATILKPIVQAEKVEEEKKEVEATEDAVGIPQSIIMMNKAFEAAKKEHDENESNKPLANEKKVEVVKQTISTSPEDDKKEDNLISSYKSLHGEVQTVGKDLTNDDEKENKNPMKNSISDRTHIEDYIAKGLRQIDIDDPDQFDDFVDEIIKKFNLTETDASNIIGRIADEMDLDPEEAKCEAFAQEYDPDYADTVSYEKFHKDRMKEF